MIKNVFASIIAGVLLSTSIADAKIADTIYLGSLKAHETKSVRVTVPQGKNTIEVFNPYFETKFNCSFTDATTRFTGLEQLNVPKCHGTVTNDHIIVFDVEVTNLSGYDIDYRIVERNDSK